MTLSSTIQPVPLRHQAEIDAALRRTVMLIRRGEGGGDVQGGPLWSPVVRVPTLISPTAAAGRDHQPFYGQIEYHLGWVNADFSPSRGHSGKLLRPTLLLLAYEAAGAWGLADEATSDSAYLRRAMPAAVAIELTHNFTLIHDDIEDGDTERHHRSTLWKLWGIPQAINTGDGLFALSRLALWGVLDEGVESAIAARLGELLDRACLTLAEGQYLDISFEGRQDISVALYLDMISRKTAALMRCAAEMGALLGTGDQETIDRLRSFGYAIGIAFQVRDDLLGIWASTTELGKTPAGDIYRRKKSLPILHALEQAGEDDQQFLRTVYAQEAPIADKQVEAVLAIFARTHTKAYCQRFLAEQCHLAHEALANVPRRGVQRSEAERVSSHHAHIVATRALEDLEALVFFVEDAARG